MSAREPGIDHSLLQRVEIFSDVVLGFSLAELGLSLSLPSVGHPVAEVLTRPWSLIAFVWTFGTICLLWVRNNHLFRHFFIPNAFSLVLNFAQLGAAVMMVYMVQVLIRAIQLDGPGDVRNGIALYCGSFVLLQILLGILFLYGVLRRWSLLADRERALGVKTTMRLLSGAIAIGILGYAGFHGPEIMALSIPLVIGANLLLGRLGPFLLIQRLGLRKPAASAG